MITEEHILNDYNKLKNKSQTAIKHHRYNNACDFISKAAYLMYNYNSKYMDLDLEKEIKEISDVFFSDKVVDKKDVIIFYDYFCIDNRGLTEQYLSALIKLGYEIVYITHTPRSKNCENIYKLLESNKVEYYVVNEKQVLKSAKMLRSLFKKICPNKILVQTIPWDVEILIALNNLRNGCEKFYIDITDHAFWLGATFYNYFIEFRDFGCNLALKQRGIDREKILKLPFYPIVNISYNSEGLPESCNGKKIFISGGSIYKTKGSTKFFDIIKYILDSYDDSVFVYLGNGSDRYFNKFILDNNYENRFITYNERKDLFQILTKSFLFINTYPISGGLMSQLACNAGCLPLTLNDNDNYDNKIDEMFHSKLPIKLEFKTIEELTKTIDKYVNNRKLYENDSNSIKTAIIQEDLFCNVFDSYLKNKKNKYEYEFYDIDFCKIKNMFISIINESPNNYNEIMKSKKLCILCNFFWYTFNYVVNKIFTRMLGK